MYNGNQHNNLTAGIVVATISATLTYLSTMPNYTTNLNNIFNYNGAAEYYNQDSFLINTEPRILYLEGDQLINHLDFDNKFKYPKTRVKLHVRKINKFVSDFELDEQFEEL